MAKGSPSLRVLQGHLGFGSVRPAWEGMENGSRLLHHDRLTCSVLLGATAPKCIPRLPQIQSRRHAGRRRLWFAALYCWELLILAEDIYMAWENVFQS